jgi:hypothetical protein
MRKDANEVDAKKGKNARISRKTRAFSILLARKQQREAAHA